MVVVLKKIIEMKKYLLKMLTAVLCWGSATAQVPDGAFRVVASQYGNGQLQNGTGQQTVLKVFRDNHWIAAFFGDPGRPFNGCGGGTFEIKDGKYVETLKYYSWDSTAVGDVYKFDYQLTPKTYEQVGYMDSEKYKHYLIREKFEKVESKDVLKNAALEGVWYLKTAEWGESTFGKGKYKDVTAVKVYAFPRFAFAYYNDKTHQFVGAGGGSYQFDGKTLTEQVEYWSWGTPKFPLSVFAINFNNNQYTQEGWEKGLRETWQKSK
jgi:hypothetical protein